MAIKEKDWTVLIYANGNNELEPEIYRSLLDIKKTGSNDKVNVLMQIGREKRQLVKIMRPFEEFVPAGDTWSGVRRYYVHKNNSFLIEDLNHLNMAHPQSLYEFISWGASNYPAKYYMLVLAGHAFQIVGILADYSQDTPYILGIPEMAKVLNRCRKQGIKIDLLVLDTCYMNSIEVLYELGQENNYSVDYVLTYIGGGPISGLPYCRLIELIQNSSNLNVVDAAKKIIDGLHKNLLLVKIDDVRLEKTKKLANEIAVEILNTNQKQEGCPMEKYINSNPSNSWYVLVKEFYTVLSSMVIYYKSVAKKNKLQLIDITTERLAQPLSRFYYKLGFAKGNNWANLVSGYPLNSFISVFNRSAPEPIVLPKMAIYLYISLMNPALDKQQKNEIYKKTLAYKNWRD